MKLKFIVLGLIFIIFILYLGPTVSDKEGLKESCKNSNVLKCGKICNEGGAQVKCTDEIQKGMGWKRTKTTCKIINTKGCKANKGGVGDRFDQCVDKMCRDKNMSYRVKKCGRKHCLKGCGKEFKDCVDETFPTKPLHSEKNDWKFVGSNQNCDATNKRNYIGYMNKPEGGFKDLIATCKNSPGCAYIVRNAKQGHANFYKLCETKGQKGLDVWKNPDGPSDNPEAHEIGGPISYFELSGKNTHSGAGSGTLEPNPFALGVTLDQCKKFCDDKNDCGCIVYKKTESGPVCSLRKGPCDPKYFRSGDSNVYIKRAAAPMENDRPKNMLKVGGGACRFKGIPQKGFANKGYMSPKQCLELCAANKDCQGADFHRPTNNGAECFNFIHKQKPANYNLWTEGGAKYSGFCYRKTGDAVQNCKTQGGNTCVSCEDGYELSKDGTKCNEIPKIANCDKQSGRNCDKCGAGFVGKKEGFSSCQKIGKIDNCLQQTGELCTKCEKGFTLDPKTRKKCNKAAGKIPSCTRQEGDFCIVCDSGYGLSKDKRSCNNLRSGEEDFHGGGDPVAAAEAAVNARNNLSGRGNPELGDSLQPSSALAAHSSAPPNSFAAQAAKVVDPTIGEKRPEGKDKEKNEKELAAEAALCQPAPKKRKPGIEPECLARGVRRSRPAPRIEEIGPVAPPDPEPAPQLEETPEATCNWQKCCTKNKPPIPELQLMRPHKHKMNPKVNIALNSINNTLQEWYEKMKPLPKKEAEEPDHKWMKEENAKLDEILARIKDSEMKKKAKVKKKKKAFPIDLDVVLNDELDLESDLKNKFLKPDLFEYKRNNKLMVSSLEDTKKKIEDIKLKVKEGFISKIPVSSINGKKVSWGFGPSSVNKSEIL